MKNQSIQEPEGGDKALATALSLIAGAIRPRMENQEAQNTLRRIASDEGAPIIKHIADLMTTMGETHIPNTAVPLVAYYLPLEEMIRGES